MKVKSTKINRNKIDWYLDQPFETQLELMKNHLEICRIVINTMLDTAAEEKTGPRYSHDKPHNGRYSRWGFNRGSVKLGSQKIPVEVQRIYDNEASRHVPLEQYDQLKQLPDQDRNGNIWMVGGNGLYFWDRSERTKSNSIRLLRYSSEQGFITNHFSSLLEDQEGRIWIDTRYGISVWDGNNLTHFSMDHGLSANDITQMTMDHNGKIWIGTRGGGISVWDGQGFYSYTEHQGLPANSVYSFHFDQNQNIWTATNLGIIKLWTEVDNQLHYAITNEYTGTNQTRAIDALVSNTNKLWTLGRKDIDVVDLELQTPDTAKPNLSITGVQPFFDTPDWRLVRQSVSDEKKVLEGDQAISLSKVKFDSTYRFSNLPVDAEFPYNINYLTFQWSSTYWADPTSKMDRKGQESDWPWCKS